MGSGSSLFMLFDSNLNFGVENTALRRVTFPVRHSCRTLAAEGPMKRTWTIIGVADVHQSFKWYQSLLGLPETAPEHDDFGQILDSDGTVLLCLHKWGAHEHPSLTSPYDARPGNGLLLFFRVDNYDGALPRARGRAWLDDIVSGTATVEDIAARRKCSVRHVNMTISMAFIAPGLVKAAIDGRLPRGIGITALRDAPAEWSLQFERLGLTSS